MEQWKEFWIFPAIMAAVIGVIFFVTFWDKTRVMDEDIAEPLELPVEPKEVGELVK